MSEKMRMHGELQAFTLFDDEANDDGRQMEAMIDKLDEKQRAKQFAARVGRVAEALEPSQRKLLELIVFERMTFAEIMAELGITKSTLSERISTLEEKVEKIFG